MAGTSAALRAAELGADVVLVDDGPELGGSALAGELATVSRELGARVRDAGVEVLAPAAALGFFDGLVPVWSESTLHQIRARSHVAATKPPRSVVAPPPTATLASVLVKPL